MDKIFVLFLFLTMVIQGCSRPVYYQQTPAPVYMPAEEVVMVPVQPRRIKPLIIIDAGHGGDDKGTLSPGTPSYQEKSLTLSTSRMVRDFLRQMGYETLMTRNDDTFIPLKERASIANEAGSKLFVSVHYNSAPSTSAQGIEVFYYLSEEDKVRTSASKELASIILEEVLQSTKAKSRGVKTANFAVIRETKMPAVLVEGGFLTNAEELQKIKDPAYLKQVAFGIARGIDQYLKRGA